MLIRIFVFTLAVTPLAASAFNEPDAKALVFKADEFRVPSGEVSFAGIVKDYKNTEMVRETRYRIYNRGHEKSLVQTTFPERQRGLKLLMDNENLWLYTPNVKRAVRVSLQQRITGEVANGDIARTNFAGDYNAEVTARLRVRGEDAYLLTLTGKREGVTYPKIEYIVRKDGLPLKASFYAVSGKLLKTAQYSDVKAVLGKKCVTKTVFRDALNPAKTSVLIYANYERKDLPDSLFNKEAMND